MELRVQIINEAVLLFNEKGISFNMDEIARELKISKKTIYKYFSSKNDLIQEVVNTYLLNIGKTEKEIYGSNTLSTYEKIEKVLNINSEHYPLNLVYIESLKETFPNLYRDAQSCLNESWHNTFRLLEKGMAEGCIRVINIDVLKAMVNGFFEHMFKEKLLDSISYHKAICELSSIIINGIRK